MSQSSRPRPRRLRAAQLASVALLAVTIALAVGADRSAVMERLELWTADWRVEALAEARGTGWLSRRALPQGKTRELVAVLIDDTTLEDLDERLPIPRTRYAHFLDVMKQAGADLVLMDIFLMGRARDAAEDIALAEAIERNGRVVFTRRGVREGRQLHNESNPPFFARHMYQEVSALLFRDPDDVVRHYQLYSRERESEAIHPALALFAVHTHWRLKIDALCASEDDSSLYLGHEPEGGTGRGSVSFAVVQPHNGLLLDLAARELPFRTVSFSRVERVLAHEPEFFRGKLVLVGHTYSGSHDLHPVPTSPEGLRQMQGTFLHGYAIAALLTGSAPWRVPRGVDALLAALSLALAALLFFRLPLAGATAACLAALAAWLAASFTLYVTRGVWITTALPCLGFTVLYVECLALKLREERSDRRSAELLLASYFSPAQGLGLEGGDDPQVADRLLAARQVLAPDKYEIQGKLGQGGMSVVFRAVQHPIGRTVALKFISPRLYRDREAVARFLREARLAGGLMHPNLVAVFDSGESHGVPYIALEYVEGENLKSLISRRGQLTPAEAVGILVQALRALEHVHAHGIIHRDIKSENILLAKDGTVKITDFGIAKAEGADAFETMQQVIVGTPAYLSPEQIRGERLTGASDLYSLGVVLYEMLSGRPPFLGESTGAILIKHLNDLPPELLDLGLEVPRALTSILRRCLEKLPRDRVASAAALREELEELHLAAAATEVAEGPAESDHDDTLSIKPLTTGSTTERLVRPEKPE